MAAASCLAIRCRYKLDSARGTAPGVALLCDGVVAEGDATGGGVDTAAVPAASNEKREAETVEALGVAVATEVATIVAVAAARSFKEKDKRA